MARIEPYRVAVVGAGRMAGLIDDEQPRGSTSLPMGHVPSFRAVEDTRVVAVADIDGEKLERFSRRFGIANTYRDYREMIRQEKPDIVGDTTPATTRAEILVFAAENGVRGIWAEKGLCCSLAEADRIAAACRANGVAFNYGVQRRYDHRFRYLRAAIERGEIGQPLYAVVYAFADLLRHHCHMVDIAAYLLGDPVAEWVEGRFVETNDPIAAGRPQPTYDPAGHRYVTPEGVKSGDPWADFFRVGYRGGLRGYFIPHPGRWDVEVYGTEGRVASLDNGGDVRIRQGSPKTPEVRETVVRTTGETATVATVRDLVRALDTGGPTIGNIDVAVAGMETLIGLAHSHLSGGARVTLPVVDRSLYVPNY